MDGTISMHGAGMRIILALMACNGADSGPPDIQSLHGARVSAAPAVAEDAIGRSWRLLGGVEELFEGLEVSDSLGAVRIRPPAERSVLEGLGDLALITTGGAVYGLERADDEPLAELEAFTEVYRSQFGSADDAPAVAEGVSDPLARVVGLTDDRGDLAEDVAPFGNIRKLVFNVRDARGAATSRLGECSGVALSPWFVLTAAHCLAKQGVAEDPASIQADDDITVCQDADARSGRYVSGCENAGLFIVNVDWNALEFRSDWALVHTDSMITEYTPDFALAPPGFQTPSGMLLNSAGFPGAGVNFPRGVAYPSGVRHFGCEAYITYDRRISYTCDAVGGQSGQPVWVKESDGDRFVVAVHGGTTGLWNTGARVSYWYDEIVSAMAIARVGAQTDNGSTWEAVLP
jgi:hypothetical protein